MNEDWLDIGEDEPVGGLPAVVEIPSDLVARAQLVEACWSKLSVKQKAFLDALRDNRFNVRRTVELGIAGKTAHRNWLQTGGYATVLKVWQANAALSALERDRLLARHDDIVETLLTPKPILHQGVPTGFEEVDAAAAGRNNEVLMRAAGMFPREGAEVNVGVVFTPPSVEVTKSAGMKDAADAVFVEVSPAIPNEDTHDEASTDSGAVLPRQ